MRYVVMLVSGIVWIGCSCEDPPLPGDDAGIDADYVCEAGPQILGTDAEAMQACDEMP